MRHTSSDPFEDIDTDVSANTQEIKDLIHQLGHADSHCSAAEYINGNNDLPVCSEFDDDHWEDFFHLCNCFPLHPQTQWILILKMILILTYLLQR